MTYCMYIVLGFLKTSARSLLTFSDFRHSHLSSQEMLHISVFLEGWLGARGVGEAAQKSVTEKSQMSCFVIN